MKIKSFMFISLIIMASVLTGCSTDSDSPANILTNTNSVTDSTNDTRNSNTGTIKVSCGKDAAYSGEESVLEVTFENFEKVPEKVDVYYEGNDNPLSSNLTVSSGKITITTPANYAKNTISYFVKSGSSESNHISLNYYNSVTVSNFESFINSITSTDVVNIKVTGNYEDFKTKTELLKNENLKINLDISQLSNVVIGEKTFSECKSLVGIKLPDNITSIGKQAFAGCTSLVGIKLPDNITSIGDRAFLSCFNLAEITFPNKLTTIGIRAFASFGTNSNKLTSIELPETLLIIGDGAFLRCKELVTVKLQNGITTIGREAFGCCEKLKNIYLPDSITSIGDDAFNCCLSLNSITIPSGVTEIPDSAFAGCKNLENVIIPNGITTIGNVAFDGCIKLETIEFPSTITKIVVWAFHDCNNLKNVIFTERTGWKVTNHNTSEETNVSDNDLADTAKSALYLRETYLKHTWTRS